MIGQDAEVTVPEEMVLAYDTLSLADAYSVIAYHLRNIDAVRAYMKVRDAEADAQGELPGIPGHAA